MPHLNKGIEASLLDGRKPMNAGELTWTLWRECVEYVSRNGRSFSVFCIVMGSLVCCIFELYRKRIGPYEDEKIAENGEALGGL